jgi:glycosyltransferase involved in cell wall biosynthesis
LTGGLPPVVHLASGREWRGGERQVLLLATELARLGLDQRVITRRGGRLERELVSAGVPVRPVRWGIALSPWALGAAWREARTRSVLLHAHDSHALTVAILAARAAGAPVVATRRTAFPLARRSLWRLADRVIAVAEAARTALIQGGVSPERIALVPSGIDPAATCAVRPRPIRRELGLPGDTPLAVNVAALTWEKDHATLIRAAVLVARAASRLHWVIAGDGPLRRRLERLARDLGVGERIHFLGWTEAPNDLIAAADLFVLTSCSEGAATVLLDAMALGVPVVATRAGGVPETLATAGLLVPVGDAAAVSAAMLQLLEDARCRRKLRTAAAAAVTNRTARGMARAVLAVYRSVVLRL